jgi:dTDP-4-amino-4,6-dideoxygalactose transaminase
MPNELAIRGGNKLRSRPFVEWPQFDERELRNVESVIRSRRWFAGMRGGDPGSCVLELERSFAALHGAQHAVANANGTVAIEIALRALGVGPGDEVIVLALTFIATASAVMLVGAHPVMVDVDEQTYCIDPALIQAAISPRTRAVIPVHYGGQMCDMERLLALAQRHKLAIVEDCAHAPGAVWRGKRAGSIGDCGTFSFQESKTMTAGEGGMITTNSAQLAEACIQYRSCGRHEGESWYIHYVLPVNYRMAELLAAVLVAQLERLPQQLDARQRAAAYLNAGLAQIPGIRPVPPSPDCEVHGYYLFQFRYDASRFDGAPRESFVRALEAEGIPCHIGYPWPLSRNPVFKDDPSVCDLRFPVAEKLCAETVVIPHQVLLSVQEDLDDVIRAVAKINERRSELAVARASAS